MMRLGLRDHERPFWILTALAVALLLAVSVTAGSARAEGGPLAPLARSVGSLRAHHEALQGAAEGGHRGVAFNAELGDGGAAFYRRAMARAARTALRHARALPRSAGAEADAAAVAQLTAELQWLVLDLSLPPGPAGGPAWSPGPRDPETVAASLARIEAAAAVLAGATAPAATVVAAGDAGTEASTHDRLP